MPQEQSQRDSNAKNTKIGILRGIVLDPDVSVNQQFIRNVRVTDEGFEVDGHAHRITAALSAQVDDGGVNFQVDVSEEDAYLLLIENLMDEDVTLDLFGVGTNIFVPLETTLVIAAGAQFSKSYTDPWTALDVTLTGPAAPTGGVVTAEVLRRT